MMLRPIAFAALIVPVYLLALASAGESTTIGLYYPDFRAIRLLIGPDEQTTLPPGAARDVIVKAWREVCKEGRVLLLQEGDLALVIVDPMGRWLYRSSNVPSLRILHSSSKQFKVSDLESLLAILDDLSFQRLRNFYNELLFAGARSTAPQRIGKLLAAAVSEDTIPSEQADWFRSIVGAEIQALDARTRQNFLSDPTYGPSFLDAVALATVRQNEQWQVIVTDDSKHNLKRVSFGAASLKSAYSEGQLVDVDIKALGDRQYLTCGSLYGKLYFHASDSRKDSAKLFSEIINAPEKVPEAMREGTLQVYLGPSGGTGVYKLETKEE